MSIKTKTISVFLSVATVLCLSGAITPMTASAALTQSQIDSIISLLQSFGADSATVSNVRTSLTGGTPTTPTGTGTYTFATDLKLGSTGTDVKNLQIVLNKDSATQVAVSGAGSPGNETTSFGSLTKAAVIKFQNKYASEVLTPIGLIAGTGYVGSLTRAKLNALYGVVTTGGTTDGVTTVTPIGTGLTVTAGTQPTASLAPYNASRIPFTVVNFTASADGDVTVNSIVVERTGLAADATLSGIILLDENNLQLGLEKTLNSVHQVTLTEAFVVKAGQTRTMTLAGNRPATAGSHGGEIAYLALVAVNTSATVNGTLPITGIGQTINETLAIGSITNVRGPLDPGTTASKEVGTTGYTFSSIKITAGSNEKIRLSSIRWNQSGSAAKDDLANIKTYVDGVAYDAVVSSDGKYYTSSFGNGIVIDKGFSKEMSVKGDIVSGSARTIDFDIYKTTDLYLKGETYGYGIAPSAAAAVGSSNGWFTTSQPWYNANAVTVSAGTLVVSKNTAFAAQNIAVNLAEQPLGAFDVEAKGEPVSVAQMVFTVASSSCSVTTGTGYLTNVSMYDENGKVVAGPIDGTLWTASQQTLTFADTVTFSTGKHAYTIKGKVASGANCVYTVSTTPSASATAASNWTTVKGQNTGVTIYPTPYTAVSANAVTLKAGALDVSVSIFPLAQTVIAGVTQFTFANYVLNAGNSGEDVSANSIKLSYTATSSTKAQLLTNCKLYDGTTAITTGSNVVTPTAAASNTAFTFDAPLSITKGTSKTIALKCDIAGSAEAGSTWQWGYGWSATVTDTTILGYISPMGKVSGQDITETFPATLAAGDGQEMTAAAGGSYTVVDDSTAGYSIVAAGTAGVTLLKLKFIATSENIDIYKADFYLSGAQLTYASSSRNDLTDQKLYLYDAANPTVLLGTAQFNQTATNFASSTLFEAGAFRVPAGSYKTMLVKGDISAINYTTGPLQASGDLLRVAYLANNGGTSGSYGKGASSGTTISDGTTINVIATGVRIMKAYPTLAKIDLTTNEKILQSGSQKPLYKFSVKAENSDVYLYKWTFIVSSSSLSATSTNYGLYVYTDSNFSSADSSFSSDGLINYGSCVNGWNSDYSTAASSTLTLDASNAAIQGGKVQIYPDKGTTCNAATTTYKVPSGTTRYFILKATMSHVESTASVTEYINVDLEGDANYPVIGTRLMDQAGTSTVAVVGVNGVNNPDKDFIWSPNSTSSVNGWGDLDWTNGYQVSGLSGTNMPIEILTSSN